GLGRRSEPENYRLQSRGGKGITNYHTARYGAVAAVAVVEESEDLILISSDGVIIRIPVGQVSVLNRPSRGVRVMKTTGGERVVTIACTPPNEDEPADALPEQEGGAEENPEPEKE
ncbi:MAG: DNA gyrase subunit A, partial [Oscillospiraceae bacterium]|nr:DNA gyrase subunit A [Oscillospiraceae bacterium]